MLNNFVDINKKFLSYPTSIVYMNIRSLRLHFTNFLASINKIINEINFIVLVETNITNDENRFFNINGFNALFLNRDGRGGGIAVYVRDKIVFNQISLTSISFEAIQINIKYNKKTISLLAVYRPPNKNINDFILEMDKTINNIKNKQDVILIGDMNININARNLAATKYLEMTSSNGLQCIMNESTREDIKNHTSSCIDHIHVRINNTTTKTYAAVIKTNISDHYSLYCCVYEEKEKAKTKSQCVEALGPSGAFINSHKVNKCIKETNWNILTNQNLNANQFFEKIYETFSDIYQKCKSTKKNNKNKIRNPNPWLNENLVNCCDIRDKLYIKWQNNKRNKRYENEYKKFRNLISKKLTFAKNDYYKKMFLENKNDIRKTWQIINEITGKKTNNIDDTITKNFKSENIQNIANNFAENFNKNVQKILHNCDITTFNYQKQSIPNTMFICPTSEQEVYNILKTLNIKKGAGIDGIRPKDLRSNAIELTPVLTALVNASIKSSIVPVLLKTFIIRPIYKNGTKNDCNNYRPIAILSVIEKILEEIIVSRLTDFLKKYKILNPSQYGFQRGKNINQLLGNFSHSINQYLNENYHCLALFIDFSKAFDTLSHAKLLEALERIGIRGECLNWFKNYLELRAYRVKIKDVLSNEAPSNHGVPQGSKLGPILYIIYANEMLNILKESLAFAYADDTAIIVANKDIKIATNTMQDELNKVAKWCHDNGLIINASKTKLMHIKSPQMPNFEINLKFHDTDCLHNINNSANTDFCSTIIETVKTYKYLGVYVDQNFKWLTHIQHLQNKLKSASYSLYYLSNCATYSVLKQAYFSLAESYLRHGITAWGNSSYCKNLQRSQNQILKILWKNHQRNTCLDYDTIYGINNTANVGDEGNTNIDSTTTAFNNYINTSTYQTTYSININNTTTQNNNLNINNNIASKLGVLNVNSIYKTTLINEFSNERRFLQNIDHNYHTRSRAEGRFKVERHRNNYGKNVLNVMLPNIINKLPVSLIQLQNPFKRKKELKFYFISTQ